MTRWLRLLSDSGRHYYFNLSTSESQWRKPACFKSRGRLPPVPEPYALGFDDELQRLFYYHTETHSVVWRHPTRPTVDVEDEDDEETVPALPEVTHSGQLYLPEADTKFVTYTHELGPELPETSSDTIVPSSKAALPVPSALVDLRDARPTRDYACVAAWSPWLVDTGSPSASASSPLTQFADHWSDVSSRSPVKLPPPLIRSPVARGSRSSSHASPDSPTPYLPPQYTHEPADTPVGKRMSVDGQWEQQFDPDTGRLYYFHYPTGSSTWDAPDAVEFFGSSSSWRTLAPSAVLIKPPEVVAASQKVLLDALGDWPPRHGSARDALRAITSVEKSVGWNGSPSTATATEAKAATQPSTRPISHVHVKRASVPQYVAERLIDKLDKRSSDVALLKTSVSMQQQVVQAGKALRVLYSSDKGKEVDTLSQISLSLSSGSGAFDLNAFQDLDSVSEDTDTIGGHSDAVSGK